MVREQRGLPAAVVGGPKERHMRQSRPQFDPSAPVPESFAAKPLMPKSKHHTYFEFVTNENKKKKLEYKVTTNKEPPPGFEFVPIGNPDLTTACKEISREKDAMIFIVSNAKAAPGPKIADQIHRTGHHIREIIVEEAKASLRHFSQLPVVTATTNGAPEPIPDSQDVYHAQADAALRDLFPRIPNTDRQIIIDHSFTRGVSTKGVPPVGLSKEIPLARRVQLAVLAHIRHNHTPYDQYLKEVSWENARKLVEQRCLDTLVQWRGDEETGRDQLDEILREVVVISDSETGDSDDESTDATSTEDPDTEASVAGPSSPRLSLPQPGLDISMDFQIGQTRHPPGPVQSPDPNQQGSKSRRRNQRGFKRYRAWEEAIRRNREVRGSSSSTVTETDPGPYSTYPRQQPLRSGPIMLPIHRPPFGGSAASRPLTPPSHDVPLPSIEQTSPMQPSFVRRIPPPRPMDNQHQEAWNQPPFQTSAPLGRSAPFMVTSGPASQYSAAPPPQAPPYPYQPPYGTEVYLHARQVNDVQPPGSNGHFQADPWQSQAQVPTTAHRIIMDVNRPGERSNPIVMEDRGGFYERVTQAEEPIHIREVHRWSRPPEPYGNRQFSLRRESPMVQDHDMEGGVELYPVAREPTHAVPPWRPQYQSTPQPAPLAVSDHRDHGAIHIRAVSQSPSHAEHQGVFPSPRRDLNQNGWGTARDGQYAHGQARGHGYRSPPIQASPRRHGPRGNVIVLD